MSIFCQKLIIELNSGILKQIWGLSEAKLSLLLPLSYNIQYKGSCIWYIQLHGNQPPQCGELARAWTLVWFSFKKLHEKTTAAGMLSFIIRDMLQEDKTFGWKSIARDVSLKGPSSGMNQGYCIHSGQQTIICTGKLICTF